MFWDQIAVLFVRRGVMILQYRKHCLKDNEDNE